MRTIKRRNYLQMILAISLIWVIILVNALCIMSTKAASPYHATLATSNFTLQTLETGADDMSDPSHVTFHLQNGSPFWYGITVQSTPSGMTPTAANPSGDLVTGTFLGTAMLLPPAGVLPFDRSNGTYSYEALHLALAFSGPNQQVQLTLNPFDSHAAALDVLALILQLLGQRDGMAQIGLLTPGGLEAVFNEVSTMQDFSSLTNDYMQLLQSATQTNGTTNSTGTSDSGASLAQAYTCAKDLVALLTNQSEQLLLGTMLWNLLGKVISRASILTAIASFNSAQFDLGVEGFLRDEATAMGSSLFTTSNPTILIQTLLNVPPTPTPTPSQTSVTPTLTPTRTPLPVVTPAIRPTITATVKTK